MPYDPRSQAELEQQRAEQNSANPAASPEVQQAAAEHAVRQQQSYQSSPSHRATLANAAAREAEKAQRTAQEGLYRSQGIPTWTGADGNLYPDTRKITDQAAKDQEKAAKDQAAANKAAAALTAKQQRAAAIRSGRNHQVNPVDGSPIYLESESQLEARRATAAEKLRQSQLDDQIKAAEAEYGATAAQNTAQGLKPLGETARKALGGDPLDKDKPGILSEAKQEARQRLLEHYQALSAQKSGTDDWIPYNEAATPAATAAQQHLARLQATDADLTDEDLATLSGNDATKPLAAKIQNIQGILSKDDELQKAQAAHALRLADLKLRRDAPEQWAESVRARRAAMSPEELQKELEASAADLDSRAATLQQQATSLNEQVSQHTQKLDALSQQAAQRRSQGIAAGDLVSYTSPDGTVEHWPRDLAAQRESIVARLQDTQSQQQSDWAALKAQLQQYEQDATLHNEGSNLLKGTQSAQAQQQKQSDIDTLRFTPGHEQTAQEVADLDSEAANRMADLNTVWEGNPPPEAVQAINQDIANRRQAALGLGESRRLAGIAAADDLKQFSQYDKEGNEHSQTEINQRRAAIGQNLSQALGITPEAADHLISDAQAQDWTPPRLPVSKGLLADTVEGGAKWLVESVESLYKPAKAEEQTRILSSGGIAVNPSITKEQDYRKAVEDSKASPEAKAEALARYPAVREQAGQKVLDGIHEIGSIYGPDTIADYTSTLKNKPKDVSEAEWAMRFTENLKAEARHGILNTLKSVGWEAWQSFNQGFVDQRAMASGLSAGALPNGLGSETMMKDAQWANRKASAIDTTLEIGGDQSTNPIAAGLFHQAPRFIGSLIGPGIAAKGAGGALSIFAKSKLGAKLLPSVAALIAKTAAPARAATSVDRISKAIKAGKLTVAEADAHVAKSLLSASSIAAPTAAQTVQAVKALTRAGIVGAGAAGGAQTYGAQITDIYTALKAQHPEMSHAEALRAAQVPSLLSAGVTAMLTVLVPGGSDRFLARPAVAKELFKKQFTSQLQRLGYMGKEFLKGGGQEFIEEAPDELFSQYQAGVASNPDDPSAGVKAVAAYFDNLASLAVGVGVLGGVPGSITAHSKSSIQRPAGPTQTALLPETQAAAEAAIQNHRHLDATGVEIPEITQRTQTRAALALATARGGDLADATEKQLNAAGWTRRDSQGRDLPSGKYTRLKDYTGPNVLNIDTTGLAHVDPQYLAALQANLPAVAAAIPNEATRPPSNEPQPTTVNNSQPQPTPPAGTTPAGQTPASGPRPNANPATVQDSPVQGAESSPSGTPPPPSGTPVSSGPPVSNRGIPAPSGSGSDTSGIPLPTIPLSKNSSTESPTTVPSVEKSIADWLVDRHMPDAEAAAAAQAITSHPDMAGKDYDHFTRQITARDALLQSLGITGSPSKKQAAQNPLRFKSSEGSAVTSDRSGSGQLETSNFKPSTSPSLPPSVQAALDDSIPGTPSQEVFDAIKKAVQAKELTEQDATTLVAQQSGAQDHTELRQALENKLGWNTTRANTAAALHFGDKSKSDIPLAAAERDSASNRVPSNGSTATISGTQGPEPELAAAPSALTQNDDYARAKLAALSRIKDPTNKSWARQLFALIEKTFEKHHLLYDALATGPVARKHLGGQFTAVMVIDGKVTRLIDLDAMVGQFSHIENPAAALRATGIEEDVHALVLQLSRNNPEKYGYPALVKKWKALPDKLKQAVWQSYNNADASIQQNAPLPANLSSKDEWHMMNEFLRMLVQDKHFAGQITETVDSSPGLIQWVKDLLKDLGNILRNLLKDAPPALQKDIKSMVAEIGQRLKDIEKPSAATAGTRLETIPTLADTQGVTQQALTTLLKDGQGILSPAALARIWDQLDPALQKRVFAQKERTPRQATLLKLPYTAATRAPKHELMQELLTLLLTDPAAAQSLLDTPPKTPTLLNKLVSSLFTLQRVLETPANTPASSPPLAALHAQILRLLASLSSTRFVQSLPPAVTQLVTTGPAPIAAKALVARSASSDSDSGIPLPTIPLPKNSGTESTPPAPTPEPIHPRAADFLAAIEAAEKDHSDAALDADQSKLRAKLRLQEVAATRTRFFLRDNAAREQYLATQAGRQDVDKATALQDLALGRIGARRPASAWRTLGLTERRRLALLGIGVDQHPHTETGGYPYSLSRIEAAELLLEFSLAGTPEHQMAQEELDWMRQQPADYQTALDPLSPAYVERDHVIIKQSTLDDLALSYPHTAALILPEWQIRQSYGLRTDARSAQAKQALPPAPPEERQSNTQQPELPAQPPASGNPVPNSGSGSGIPLPTIPLSKNSATESTQRPAKPVTFDVPVKGEGTITATFPDTASREAFQFKHDLARSRKLPSGSERTKLETSLSTLKARFMADLGLGDDAVTTKLAAYHEHVVAAAAEHAAKNRIGGITAPQFEAFSGGRSAPSTKSLPAPVGGDLIADLARYGIGRISSTVQPGKAGDMDWFKSVTDGTAGPHKQTALILAVKAADAGELTTPLARRIWLAGTAGLGLTPAQARWERPGHVLAPNGMPIDAAASTLSSQQADGSGTPYQFESGDALGLAILEALDSRIAAKGQSADPTLAAESDAQEQSRNFATLISGNQDSGQSMTGAEIAAQLDPDSSAENTLKLGTAWFTVDSSDDTGLHLTASGPDADLYGQQTLAPDQSYPVTQINDRSLSDTAATRSNNTERSAKYKASIDELIAAVAEDASLGAAQRTASQAWAHSLPDAHEPINQYVAAEEDGTRPRRTPRPFVEGELTAEHYGEDPYIYRNEFIDPRDYRDILKLEGLTYEQVAQMPSTQNYIQWYREGHLPPPVTVVKRWNDGRNYATDRRRMVAALEAGIHRIPAQVEIGRASELSPKLAASNRTRLAAASFVEDAIDTHGLRTFADLLRQASQDLPAAVFTKLRSPHFRAAWNWVMAERGLPEVSREEEQSALRTSGPKIERRYNEPDPETLRRASSATDDSIGIPTPASKAPSQQATPKEPSDGLNLDDEVLSEDPNKKIQNYGSTEQQREQAIDETFGPMAPGVSVMDTKNQDGVTLPHIMRGRGLMLAVDGSPHVAVRQAALPSLGTGQAPGVRFLPLAGDKSNWTGFINQSIQKADPDLDQHTDYYLEPYGGGLVYLQNLDVLLRTEKPVIIASSEEFEPDRNAIYNALREGDPATMADMQATLADMTHVPKTDPGTRLADLLFGGLQNRTFSAASLEAAKQLPRLAELLRRPNVLLKGWNDVQTFNLAVKLSQSGKRVTLLEDSNYADLPGEETEDQYASLDTGPLLPGMSQGQITEFIGKNPHKLLAQKLPVYRAVLDAGGTVIATNNMNPTLLNGLLSEFGDAGHWFGYAHPTRVVPDGWMRHPDGKGVLWSNQRPEYLAILQKGVVNPPEGAPKYGTDTPAGLDYRTGPRRTIEELNRAAQPHRTPSPYTGGSREAAESLRPRPAAPVARRPIGQSPSVNTDPRTPKIDSALAGGPDWDATTSAQVSYELDQDLRDARNFENDLYASAPQIDDADLEDELGASADRYRPEEGDEDSPALPAAARTVEHVEPGFYSALAEAIRAKMPARSTPATVVGILKNAGIKTEELKWTGILPWLQQQAQNGPITQQQVLDYLKDEGSVQFTVTRLGEDQSNKFTVRENTSPPFTYRQIGDAWATYNAEGDRMTVEQSEAAAEEAVQNFTEGYRKAWIRTHGADIPQSRWEVFNPRDQLVSTHTTEIDAREAAANYQPSYQSHGGHTATSTRNTHWTLAGGTNHTEVVITYKQRPIVHKSTGKWTLPDGSTGSTAVTTTIPAPSPNSDSDTTHYGDLNALAWYRAAEHGTGLLVDEFQSKWHQQGREKGYQFDPNNLSLLKATMLENGDWMVTSPDGSVSQKITGPSTEKQALINAGSIILRKNEQAVPDAPYRTTWPLMLFKRALQDAVTHGKAWIGWTTGDTQADRYDLSKQVSKVGVTRAGDLTYSIDAMPTDGGRYTQIAAGIPAEKLPEHVGKELATKIVERNIAPGANAIFSGLDLKIGGEGMRGFYDNILPKEIGKYVKQWGGAVKQSEVNSSTSVAPPSFSPISDSDWETFGGAEEFANGDRPLLSETTINVDGSPQKVQVIIDANGLQMMSEDGETNWMAPKDVFPGRSTWSSSDLATISVETAWKNEASKFWKELQPIVGEGTASPRQGTTPIWRIDITPQMKAGVEAGQALFATPRRAYESMTFDPPFHTRFGDILSYDWMNQPVGGLSSQRTSDWSRARTNPATGRDIVHHFKVQKPDGIHTVSLETALGQLTEPQRHKLQSLIKSEQRRREEAAAGQMTLFAAQRTPILEAIDRIQDWYSSDQGAIGLEYLPQDLQQKIESDPRWLWLDSHDVTEDLPEPNWFPEPYSRYAILSHELTAKAAAAEENENAPALTPAEEKKLTEVGQKLLDWEIDDGPKDHIIESYKKEIEERMESTIEAIEATGRWEWTKENYFEATDEDPTQVLYAAPRVTDPPFSTQESKTLENTRIHAIDTYLHGKRRPIADTPPADQAGSSRAQLQALLQHARRSQRPSGPPAADENARIAEARRHDKTLLINWARNAGVLLSEYPDRYPLNSPQDKGGSEHHVFPDASNRWVKITKGDGSSFGYQPLDEGKDDEWMISKAPADLLSYLEKLALHNHVFHDDIILHGVVADPLGKVALIISQPHYKGTFAGVYTAIKPAMEAAGFVRVEPPSARKEEPSAYYRPSDNVAVIDLHSENAILEDNGTFLRVFDNIMLHPTGALRATFERLAAKRQALPAAQRVATAAAETDPNPSDAQKAAGNYSKGKVTLHGLRLSIENPRGSVRSGTDATGKPWSVTMPHHYGYFLGTEGKDGDHVDFFLGPNPDSQTVLIVNQRKIPKDGSAGTPARSGSGSGQLQTSNFKPSTSSEFDEHKVMLGFDSPAQAAKAYLAAYTPGWKGLQSAIPTTIPVLKEWLQNHDTTKPVTREGLARVAQSLPSGSDSDIPLRLHSLAENSGTESFLLPASHRVEQAAKALDKTVTTLGQAANLIPKAVGKTLAAITGTGQYIPGNAAMASFGTALGRADAAAAAKVGTTVADALQRVSGKDIRKAPDAVAAWLGKPDGLGSWTKSVVVDQLLPTALMPREWLALSHEMQRKTAFGAEKSNDLIRALSGNPRLSDLAYPEEFAKNPAYREQLFDAMENKIPMSSLPPAMQALGTKLRAMLRETGLELVKQGLMHPDTFEELQANGWMPRYMLEEAQESGGSVLAAFKLGVKDLMQQRSTAFHIVDTTRKGKDGQYLTVNRKEGGRNAWRFRDAATRDAFYSDFIRRQALDMLQDTHGNTKELQTMMATLDGQQRREIRAQIKLLTRADMDSTQKLSPALAGMVKQAIEHQKYIYRKEAPFDPPKLIKDPVYSIARYILAQTHNAATMELLNETAKNKDWTSNVSLQGFTEIPDNDRFGPLAGKFVQKDIAQQILDKLDVPNAALRFYDAVLRKWKSGKLVWNPGSHIRDAVGNTVFAYLGGSNIANPGNWPYYRQAMEIMRNGGPLYNELLEHGVLGGDAYSSLVRERLKGLLPDAKTVENFNPGLIQRLFLDFGSKFHATHEQLAEYRRVPDDFYKIAAYLKAKATFASDPAISHLPSAISAAAAAHVRKWFPYYDRLGGSATTRAAGRFVNPFLSFFRESTRILATAAVERPIALAAALAFPAAISALSAMLLGLDDRDRDEISKDLAGRGKGILGLSSLHLFSMLLPVRSSQGQVQQFDISAIMPFADLLGQKIVPLEEKENAWQTFWRQTAAAGPIGNLGVSWITNRDLFSGRHLTEADMSTPEMLRAYTQHAAGVALPPLAPDLAALVGIGDGGALSRSGQRQTNKTLQTYDTTQTVIRSIFGMNVKSAAPNIYRQADDFRKAHGYDAQPDFDYGTTATSRAKRALVQQLAQDQPNPTAIKNLVKRLKDMGVPLDTPGAITKVLKIIDPASIIGGSKKQNLTAEDARQRFRQSLPPESRALYEASLQEYRKIQQRAPMLLRSAQ